MENILNTEKDEEVVINNTFRDYYYEVLTPKVVLFNTLVGGDFKNLSEEDKASRIDLQIDIVSEELIKEYAVFFAKDQVEELDAIADVLFTVSYLQYQLKVCDEQGLNDLDINHDRLQFLMSQIGLFFESMYTHFDLDIIIKATDLVVENNMLKFTTDKEAFDKWKAPAKENLSASEQTVDGVTYYCLVNENGKVRKRKGFKVMDLSGLVEEQYIRDVSLCDTVYEDMEGLKDNE